MKEETETSSKLKPNRFFIVFFMGSTSSGHTRTSFREFSTTDNYLNKSVTFDMLEKSTGLKNITITNIIELNKSDFNDWQQKD
jgi:hypothetical protein